MLKLTKMTWVHTLQALSYYYFFILKEEKLWIYLMKSKWFHWNWLLKIKALNCNRWMEKLGEEARTRNKQWCKRGLSYWGNWLWWNHWDALHPIVCNNSVSQWIYAVAFVFEFKEVKSKHWIYPPMGVRVRVCAVNLPHYYYAHRFINTDPILPDHLCCMCGIYNIFPAQVHFPYLNIIFRCRFHKPLLTTELLSFPPIHMCIYMYMFRNMLFSIANCFRVKIIKSQYFSQNKY